MFFSSNSGKNTDNYRLKVTAGPEYDPSTHQIVPVNSDQTLRIENEHAIINLCVRVQDYTGKYPNTPSLSTKKKKDKAPPLSKGKTTCIKTCTNGNKYIYAYTIGLPNNSPKTSPYFDHPLHQNDQYSICFALIPKHDVSGDDLVFGNDFDRPIRDRIPPGFKSALRIVRWAIDPALDGDPYADKPYLYSPGLASWNQFRVGGKVDLNSLENDDKKVVLNLHDEGQIIEEGAEDDEESSKIREELGIPEDSEQRKKFFLDESNRKKFVFEKGRLYFVDFGNPYIGFSGQLVLLSFSSICMIRGGSDTKNGDEK
jgi:hypothetical protein